MNEFTIFAIFSQNVPNRVQTINRPDCRQFPEPSLRAASPAMVQRQDAPSHLRKNAICSHLRNYRKLIYTYTT
ncbi:MAG: hypothetical protein KUG69_06375, partial [Marinosulfonomonas sp.]|nr:hypothetical protein [Marinosulfonomonas sp.]